MKTILMLGIAMALLVGCATAPPTADDFANVGPLPADYQDQVKKYFEESLIDPDSAKYYFVGEPKVGAHEGYGLNRTPRVVGWIVSVEVNAKNRMGGYTGRQLHKAVLNQGKVVRVLGPDDPGRLHYQN